MGFKSHPPVARRVGLSFTLLVVGDAENITGVSQKS
jgi:hypothetical protein